MKSKKSIGDLNNVVKKFEHFGFTKGTPTRSGKSCRVTIPALDGGAGVYEISKCTFQDEETRIVLTPTHFTKENLDRMAAFKKGRAEFIASRKLAADKKDVVEDGVGTK